MQSAGVTEERRSISSIVTINSAEDNTFSVRKSLRELWRFRPLIFELLRRDLKLRYKNSVGGIAWSLTTPLLQIAVITVMMKFINAHKIDSYSAYLFPVIFLWTFFQTALLDSSTCILTNAPLIRKVYFPRAILPMMSLMNSFFHFGVAFIFTLLYYFIPFGWGGVGAYPAHLRLEFLMVFPSLFFLSLFVLGLGYVLAYLNVFYEDVRFIMVSLLPLFFYAMPVFYTIEQVKAQPNQWIYQVYMLNPVATFLVTYQRALLAPPEVLGANRIPLEKVGIPWGYFGIACLVSLLTLYLGYTRFERRQWEVVERL